MLNHDQSPRLSVIGGVTYPRKSIPLSKGALSWPFARLSLYEDRIVLGPRSALSSFQPTVAIPYSQISHIEVSSPPILGELGGTVTFRWSNDEFDRIAFSAWRSAFRTVLQQLADMGVTTR